MKITEFAEKWKTGKVYRFLVTVLFPALLLLYPMRHIMYGVDWWDTGYNYGNFMYMDRMDSMWMFSTYLANGLGHFLTKLPFGHSMLGLNFYTGLPVCILALSAYYFFVKKIKFPPVLVFIGEVIAIGLCWCPTALLYNYLTYLLLFAGTVCLYQALTENKRQWFIAAGICLGVNVFVRFSNLAQMALIAAVWAYAFLKRKQGEKGGFWKKAGAWTGWCVLGYVLGAGSIFGYICMRYGAGEYVAAVQRLMGMSAEATSYTISAMIESQVRNYLQNMTWLLRMVPFVLIGVIGFAVLPGKLMKLKKAGYVFCMGLVFYWLRNQDMFNFTYSTKESAYQWAVCLLTFIMVAGICTIFSKKATDEEKLLCGLSMLIALVTPLGSNNHLYSSINNLFFGAPVVLWILWSRLRAVWNVKNIRIGKVKAVLYSYPLKATVAMIVGMLLVQSIGLGFGYVFVESGGGENLHTKLEKSDILKGMYTDDVRAEQFETLLAYVQEHDLTGREVILYGDIPALSYYLEMPFAMTSWPDLPSYNYEVMCQDVEKIAGAIREKEKVPPVLLVNIKYGADMKQGSEVPENKKTALLQEFAWEFGYEPMFANDKFMLFESVEK